MTAQQQKPLAIVQRIEDIPTFATEDEEHAFWSAHEFSKELWTHAEPLEPDALPPPRQATTAVLIYLDNPTLARVKRIARRHHKPYQTVLGELIKQGVEQQASNDPGEPRRRP